MIPALGNETSANRLYVGLQAMLADVVPNFELKLKAELAAEINRLKVKKDSFILGHNYMEPALFHSIPDYVGDSLDLARRAATTDKDVIVFCGVRFMAETAKILNPARTVLLPSKKAGCSLAASITAADVRELKQKFPDVVILAHPECSPEVVGASDYSGSTNAMIRYVEQTKAPRYLLLTECSMGENIAAANADKEMLRLCSVRCQHMNQITLEDTLASLQKGQHVIEIPGDILLRAARAVERMMAIG